MLNLKNITTRYRRKHIDALIKRCDKLEERCEKLEKKILQLSSEDILDFNEEVKEIVSDKTSNLIDSDSVIEIVEKHFDGFFVTDDDVKQIFEDSIKNICDDIKDSF